MGLFSKVKDILFEEEKTEQIDIVKDIKEEPVRKIKEEPSMSFSHEEDRYEEKKEPIREIREERMEVKKNNYDKPEPRYESDTFRMDNSFSFPDFDEEEFATTVKQRPRTVNVLEYERKKKTEKRTDLGKYEKIETREVVEKKRFKPSPIISPVFGILNEDYTVSDIKQRNSDNIDVDWVRKKAFEPERVKEEKPVIEEEVVETVTVSVEEPVEEKTRKVKTIDDLLEDTSDIIVEDTPSREKKNSIQYSEIDDDYEDEIDFEDTQELICDNEEEKVEEDTLENDLFDLIDSMYETREDGEI